MTSEEQLRRRLTAVTNQRDRAVYQLRQAETANVAELIRRLDWQQRRNDELKAELAYQLQRIEQLRAQLNNRQ